MKHRAAKRALIAIAVVLGAAVCAVVVALVVLQVRTGAMLDDWTGIYDDDRYRTPVSVEGVEVIEQDVSCGYAVIEMFSAWSGGDITEESLYDQYGSVVTSTGPSFCDEMNKQFPQYTTTMRSWLTDTELLDALYQSLARGMPVPIEWAAKLGDDWTLHYSLVTGMDVPADRITVANPYGYTEQLPIADFLSRTSFEAYGDMPLFLRLGFAFGIFEKNAIFTVS